MKSVGVKGILLQERGKKRRRKKKRKERKKRKKRILKSESD